MRSNSNVSRAEGSLDGTCPDGPGSDGNTGRARSPGPNDDRTLLYDEVTHRIIGDLELGRVPWVKPWSSEACTGGALRGMPVPGLPRNAATCRPYSGIIILLLWGSVMERGFASQGWLTFRQALASGTADVDAGTGSAEGGQGDGPSPSPAAEGRARP